MDGWEDLRSRWAAEAQREREEDWGPATMGDAHREWHLNAGVPMGQQPCPFDACDPYWDEDVPSHTTAVRNIVRSREVQ